MTKIELILEQTGIKSDPKDWNVKKIKLRDGRNAILWVNKNNGHGILDPEFWITKEEYEAEYRKAFSATLNSKTTPQEHRDIYRLLNKRQFNQFAPLIKNANILEIGSSFGGIIEQIENSLPYSANSITSVEPNREDADFLKKEYPNVNVHNTFFTKDIKFENPFDLIISFEVLEHIEKPNDFIKGIVNNLKVGGLVNIEVPNHDDGLLSLYNNDSYKNFYYHKAHIHYFTKNSLIQIFHQEGIDGYVSGFQMYPILNQIYWIMNNKPQNSATEALNIPKPILDIPNNEDNINHDINRLITELGVNYNEIVERNYKSDCLVFKGKRVK